MEAFAVLFIIIQTVLMAYIIRLFLIWVDSDFYLRQLNSEKEFNKLLEKTKDKRRILCNIYKVISPLRSVCILFAIIVYYMGFETGAVFLIVSSVVFMIDTFIITLAIKGVGKNSYIENKNINFKVKCHYFVEAKDRIEVIQRLREFENDSF